MPDPSTGRVWITIPFSSRASVHSAACAKLPASITVTTKVMTPKCLDPLCIPLPFVVRTAGV